jgi:GDP-4-dehydro-6-deoxy-D-mannose reductase
MRVLITGITGFAGGHLAELASKKKGVQVYGLRRPGSAKKAPGKARLVACDLRDAQSLARAMRTVRPDRIFHLAAVASVAQSWKDPKGTFENNVHGTELLMQAVLKHAPRARVHIAGSAEVYGDTHGRPARESSPLKPLNPYAKSKVAQEETALRYFKENGISVVCTRAFNHLGPRQSAGFVSSDFARQVALAEAGKKEPLIQVGNLSAVRDFTDVRDVVRAYWLCLEKGEAGELYNVASGQRRRVSDLLDSYLKLSTVKIKVVRDRSLFRKVETPVLLGDPSKLRADAGWKAAIPFERTVRDVLGYWRKEVRK